MSYNEFHQGRAKLARLHAEACTARLAHIAQRRDLATWLRRMAARLDPV